MITLCSSWYIIGCFPFVNSLTLFIVWMQVTVTATAATFLPWSKTSAMLERCHAEAPTLLLCQRMDALSGHLGEGTMVCTFICQIDFRNKGINVDICIGTSVGQIMPKVREWPVEWMLWADRNAIFIQITSQYNQGLQKTAQLAKHWVRLSTATGQR